jgi:hypothetical protein
MTHGGRRLWGDNNRLGLVTIGMVTHGGRRLWGNDNRLGLVSIGMVTHGNRRLLGNDDGLGGFINRKIARHGWRNYGIKSGNRFGVVIKS